jgi:hypothetical protein
MFTQIILPMVYGIYFFIIGATISYIIDVIPPPLNTEKSYIAIWFEIMGQIALLAVVSHYALKYFRNTQTFIGVIGLSNEKFRNNVIQNIGNIIIPFAVLLFQQNLNEKILHVKYKINELLVNTGILTGEPTGPTGSGMWVGEKPFSARPHIDHIF